MLKLFMSSLTSKSKPCQIDRYEANKSPDEIKKIISFGGGPKMGSYMEHFARFNFPSLKTRENTGHDQVLHGNEYKIKVEQKSSGHWGQEDYKWQHIEDKHDWDILLLCGIDYQDIKFWTMNRKMFQAMLEEGKITNQGKKSGESSEGVWFNYSDVKDVLVEVQTNEQLVEASRV